METIVLKYSLTTINALTEISNLPLEPGAKSGKKFLGEKQSPLKLPTLGEED